MPGLTLIIMGASTFVALRLFTKAACIGEDASHRHILEHERIEMPRGQHSNAVKTKITLRALSARFVELFLVSRNF